MGTSLLMEVVSSRVQHLEWEKVAYYFSTLKLYDLAQLFNSSDYGLFQVDMEGSSTDLIVAI